MSLTGNFGIVAIILVVFNGCSGAPKPCPQFLPVAVRLDQHIPTSYSLKTLIKVKDDKKKEIPNPESNLVISPTDLLLPDVRESTTKKDATKLLQISELSTPSSGTTRRPKFKKRRRAGPKEPKRIILNRNSNWALRTINDKPAHEVLMTDKASLARDLKDSTESALVSVRKLEEIKH